MGAIIDSKLTFKPHVKSLLKKLGYKTSLMGRIRKFLDEKKSLVIYKHKVVPYCDYASFLVDCTTNTIMMSTVSSLLTSLLLLYVLWACDLLELGVWTRYLLWCWCLVSFLVAIVAIVAIGGGKPDDERRRRRGEETNVRKKKLRKKVRLNELNGEKMNEDVLEREMVEVFPLSCTEEQRQGKRYIF